MMIIFVKCCVSTTYHPTYHTHNSMEPVRLWHLEKDHYDRVITQQ